MAQIESLDFSELTWETFQQIGVHIGDVVHNHLKFEEYLKPGNVQHGIDLYAYDGVTEKYHCVQCKREKEMTVTDMGSFIKKFREGRFYGLSSHFVIMTMLDLQNKKQQEGIEKYREELAKDNIIFDVWDKNFLEKRLKDMYQIVHHYFGCYRADAFCFQPVFSKDKTPQPTDFLDRQVRFFEGDGVREERRYRAGRREDTSDLISLFNDAPLSVHHLCLLGDPHQGKTHLLKYVAHKLEHQVVAKVCLWVNAKTYNAPTVEAQLDTQYYGWKSYGSFRLLVIIDGVDEVPADRFAKVVQDIRDFTIRYPSVSTVFSCRTSFYYNFFIENIIADFTLIQLCALHWKDILSFLDKDLTPEGARHFLQDITAMGLKEELSSPLFLMELVNTYKVEGTFPNSRIGIITSLAGRTIGQDTQRRQLNGAKVFAHYKEKLAGLTKRFAFALQYAGVNGFEMPWMMELFSEDERELLLQSALITFTGENWSFVNAGYQEYLAAVVLAKMDYNIIIGYIAKGLRSPMVKTKWEQTFASLLSILQPGTLFNRLFEFAKQDDFEILFATEGSKFTHDQQVVLLKSFVDQCITREQFFLKSEQNISRFIYNNSGAVDLLLNYIAAKETPEAAKITCLQILCNLLLTDKQKNRLYTIFKETIPGVEMPYFASRFLSTVLIFCKIDEGYIAQLVGDTYLNKSQHYREAIYQLLTKAGLVDRYYDYGIEGFAKLVAYNNDNVMHVLSGLDLYEMLASFRTQESLEKLQSLLTTSNWRSFQHTRKSIEKFNERFAHNINLLFDQNLMIETPFVNFLETGCRNSSGRYHGELDAVLQTTEFGIIAGKYFVSRLENEYPNIPFALFRRNIDYFLAIAKAGGTDMSPGTLDLTILWVAAKASAARSKVCSSDPVLQRIMLERERLIEKDLKFYMFSRKQRVDNDLKFIHSQPAFYQAVSNFIDICVRENITPVQIVHWEEDSLPKLMAVDSHFVRWYLSFYGGFQGDKSEILDEIDTLPKFEHIRSKAILQYSYITTDSKPVFHSYLNDFFNKYIGDLDVVNWITRSEANVPGRSYEKSMHGTLCKIALCVDLVAPFDMVVKLLWLDMSGYLTINKWEDNPKSSCAALLLSYKQNHLLKAQILANLNIGIGCEQVLRTHIALVEKLAIKEALGYLEELILDANVSDEARCESVQAFISINGSRSVLISVFQSCTDFNRYLTYSLVHQIILVEPEIVCAALLPVIKDDAVKDDNRVEYSYMLAHHGYLEGFLFIIERVKAGIPYTHYLSLSYALTNVPIGPALAALEDFGEILLAPSKVDDENFINIILGFGEKSEDAFDLVCQYLERQREKLKLTFKICLKVNWYLQVAKERFRNYAERVATLEEVKDELARHHDH